MPCGSGAADAAGRDAGRGVAALAVGAAQWVIGWPAGMHGIAELAPT